MRVDLFRAIVGAMILLSVALTYFVSPYWLYFTAFIGLNLFQSAFTRFCPLDMILERVSNGKGAKK
ncbi:MAG: DUF2892 domain-containing protein [Bdellovibrionales bacterium]|nr:DUF2892 domain-containing protein [Oligoflexia bacterium]